MDFDQAAAEIRQRLPIGPAVAVFGSTSFWSPLSEAISIALGRDLAQLPGLVLLTGGVDGVGQTVARAFEEQRLEAKQSPDVFHLLPTELGPADHGTTLVAGSSMSERREILARVCKVNLVIEGGPGTVHESETALAAGTIVIPIAATGGHALDLYARLEPPKGIDAEDWLALGQEHLGPDALAQAATRIAATLLGIEPSSD